MVERKLSIKQMKTIAIVLTVVFCGVGLFDVGFSYIYKGALENGSCSLCFELNPGLAYCENWEPVNFSKPLIYIYENITLPPSVSYGK